MNLDRMRVTLTAPPVLRALQYMTDIYDGLGGFKLVDALQPSFQSGELVPFLRGQVAMKIDGDWSLESIADSKRDMDVITPLLACLKTSSTPAERPSLALGGGCW